MQKTAFTVIFLSFLGLSCVYEDSPRKPHELPDEGGSQSDAGFQDTEFDIWEPGDAAYPEDTGAEADADTGATPETDTADTDGADEIDGLPFCEDSEQEVSPGFFVSLKKQNLAKAMDQEDWQDGCRMESGLNLRPRGMWQNLKKGGEHEVAVEYENTVCCYHAPKGNGASQPGAPNIDFDRCYDQNVLDLARADYSDLCGTDFYLKYESQGIEGLERKAPHELFESAEKGDLFRIWIGESPETGEIRDKDGSRLPEKVLFEVPVEKK